MMNYKCRICRIDIANNAESIMYCSKACRDRMTVEIDRWKARKIEKKKEVKVPSRKTIKKKKLRKLRKVTFALQKEVEELKRKLQWQEKAKGFYDSREWQDLRYSVIKEHIAKHGRKCLACYQTEIVLHVDHIKPRSRWPELSLVRSNLQVLCKDCNLGKSNTDETDWR